MRKDRKAYRSGESTTTADWANWYVSRGRMPFDVRGADLRRVSWRRAL